MNIEVIEFYPIEKDDDRGILTGTLRISLPDIGIHILGVYVSRRKDSWFFSLHGRNENHHKTGERIRYPFIVFEDREKHHELIEALREKGRAFIESKLVDTENPLIFHLSEEKKLDKVKVSQVKDSSIEAKEMRPEKPKQDIGIPKNQWIDLPPRQQPRRKQVRRV